MIRLIFLILHSLAHCLTVYFSICWLDDVDNKEYGIFITVLIGISAAIYFVFRGAKQLYLDGIAKSYIRKLVNQIGFFRNRNYFVRPCKYSEIDFLYSNFQKVFGNDLLNLNELKKIHKKNHNTIFVVCCEKWTNNEEKREEIVGFFELFPLLSNSVKRLKDGKTDGRNVTLDDIHKNYYRCRNFYIASIGVIENEAINEKYTKAVVVKEFKKFIWTLNHGMSFKLYARPITKDGLRLLKKYGFVKLDLKMESDESIWEKNLPINTLQYNDRTSIGV